MPLPLKRIEISDRIRDYPRNNYLFIGSVFKGVALAAAAYVGLAIFSDWQCWPRFAPWFASLVAINVSYITWGRGVLLSNAQSNLLDSIFPFSMGLFEFGLFGVLSDKHPLLYRHWFLILALHAFFAVLLVTNRNCNTKIKRDFEASLYDLARRYKKWMCKDMIGAGVVSGLSFLIWFILNWYVWPKNVWWGDMTQTILAGITGVLLLMPIFDADNQRREIDEEVSK